jgi:PAS domain S-box-containing protein
MDKPNTINAIPGPINLLKPQKPLSKTADVAGSRPKSLAMPDSLEHILMRLITLRLVIPAIILAVLLVALSGYLYARMIDREQVQLAQSIATLTDEYLEHATQSLKTLALISEKEQLYAISSFIQAEQTTHHFFLSISLLDNNGNILFTAPNSVSQTEVIYSNLQSSERSSNVGDVELSNPYISPKTGLLTILLTRDLPDGGKIVGELNLSGLQKTISDSQPLTRQGQLFFLSDANGTLMADSISQTDLQQASLSFFRPRKMVSSNSQSQLVLNQSGLAIESEKKLKNVNWIVSAEIPLQKAFTPYLWAALITVTFFLLLWALLIHSLNRIGIKQIFVPLVELSESVRALSAGSSEKQLVSRAPSGFAEIRDLTENFNNMFAVLQQRQAAAQESEQKYRMLIDQSNDAIYVEHCGNLIITNQKFNELFGIGRDHPKVSSKGLLQFVLPASRPLVKDLQRQIMTGQVSNLRYEFSAKGADGRALELEASSSALPFQDGIAIQSILRDITDRKRTEQGEREQRVLAEALRDSASALNNTLEVDEVIERIFSNAARVVPFQAASIMLLDMTPTPQARVVACSGYQLHGGQDWVKKQRFTLENSPNLRCMYDTGKPIVIPDTAKSRLWATAPESRWVRSYTGAPIRVQGEIIGFLNLEADIPDFFNQTHSERLQAFADQAGVAIHNAHLLTDLRKSRDELYNAYETTLEGWSKALELRDYETEGHTQRVMDMTMKLAESYGITGAELVKIRYGTLLHDIGKIGIPDSILFKPGPLNEEEWEVMRRHPMYAQRILAHIPYLQDSLDIPFSHHEKWDGSGYPRGLKGKNIPLSARLFAVVDVWDGLRSNRHYRSGWPDEDVIRYIQDQSGKHFDPQVVEVFLCLLGQPNRMPSTQ